MTEYTSVKSVEVYPRTENCTVPDLPLRRRRHTTFLTSDPSPSIAICGGVEQGVWTSASCLVLDQANQVWNDTIMGSLTMARENGAAVTLNHVGVFIIGGEGTSKTTSEFLAAGIMQWQQGPNIPVNMERPCAVAISASGFLAIYHDNIREFDVVTAGPISSQGWKSASTWPKLKTSRAGWPGCAKLGQKVIVAGGWSQNRVGEWTEILDLVTRQVTQGGNLNAPRHWFHLATIREGGVQKIFALAGRTNGFEFISTVEEWVEESSTWKAADNLTLSRGLFGTVVLPRELLCPA